MAARGRAEKAPFNGLGIGRGGRILTARKFAELVRAFLDDRPLPPE
jgi:hypothetical protein